MNYYCGKKTHYEDDDDDIRTNERMKRKGFA